MTRTAAPGILYIFFYGKAFCFIAAVITDVKDPLVVTNVGLLKITRTACSLIENSQPNPSIDRRVSQVFLAMINPGFFI